MKELLSIRLENCKFWGFHGVFPEEKILGNWFTVDLTICLEKIRVIGDLVETIDYGNLYQIVKEEMSIPTELLETLLEKIKERILLRFKTIIVLEISIKKQKPAIGMLDGNSIVSLKIDLQG